MVRPGPGRKLPPFVSQHCNVPEENLCSLRVFLSDAHVLFCVVVPPRSRYNGNTCECVPGTAWTSLDQYALYYPVTCTPCGNGNWSTEIPGECRSCAAIHPQPHFWSGWEQQQSCTPHWCQTWILAGSHPERVVPPTPLQQYFSLAVTQHCAVRFGPPDSWLGPGVLTHTCQQDREWHSADVDDLPCSGQCANRAPQPPHCPQRIILLTCRLLAGCTAECAAGRFSNNVTHRCQDCPACPCHCKSSLHFSQLLDSDPSHAVCSLRVC